MREVVTVTGMVLTASTIKEYDKRVELLTRERGRISAFAQGARKPNSALSACTIPFTFGTYHLYEGKSSYNIQSAEIKEYFDGISQDFDVLCYSSYFAEMAQFFTRENVDAGAELILLYVTLRALLRQQIPVELIRVIYEMKLMQTEGEALELFQCVKCGQAKKNLEIYMSQGGYICQECVQKLASDQQGKGIKLSRDAEYTLQYILTTPIEKLYSFQVSESVLQECVQLMARYLEHYLHHDFKSLEFR